MASSEQAVVPAQMLLRPEHRAQDLRIIKAGSYAS
jgi:hypothetical protein